MPSIEEELKSFEGIGRSRQPRKTIKIDESLMPFIDKRKASLKFPFRSSYIEHLVRKDLKESGLLV